VRAIGSSPEEPFSAIYATLLSAIASARDQHPDHGGLFRARSAVLKAALQAALRAVWR
jgi:cardiolipin synthase